MRLQHSAWEPPELDGPRVRGVLTSRVPPCLCSRPAPPPPTPVQPQQGPFLPVRGASPQTVSLGRPAPRLWMVLFHFQAPTPVPLLWQQNKSPQNLVT